MTARERPILFSAPMVRAILSGAKTQTRRVIGPGREGTAAEWRTLGAMEAVKRWAPSVEGWWTMAVGEPSRIVHCGHEMDGGHIGSVQCPYGVPGDRLWVRETWAHDATSLDDLRAMVEDIVMGSNCGPYYRADGTHEGSGLTWRPSIHMPRWASRITLDVTEVRVQRLRELSEQDALAEGADPYECPSGPANPDARGAFAELWDRINGKRAPWASNPWVWCVSFKRV